MTLVWGNIKVSQVTYDGPDELLNTLMESRLDAICAFIGQLDQSSRRAHVHIVASALRGEDIEIRFTVKSSDTHFQGELELAINEYLDSGAHQ